MEIVVKNALISVYSKDGLEVLAGLLHRAGVVIYSTGGTQEFIESLGIPVKKVEDITGYPSILGGRVKTLHPKVFGGILAIRNQEHLSQLQQFDIPTFDLVIVDLYPFEATVAAGAPEPDIIEKIDIGGISLIRAAAKNFNDVVVIPSKNEYPFIIDILKTVGNIFTLDQRRYLAGKAFAVSAYYDTEIKKFLTGDSENTFTISVQPRLSLRYGENPHQSAAYYGDMSKVVHQLCGKDLSYNNLVDIDAAVQLVREFKDAEPTFAILKHTNACGVATRKTVSEAYEAALAADPISAFGGILISNSKIDLITANKINELFYEVLIAPDFDEEAFLLLSSKPKRVLLRLNSVDVSAQSFKSLLNGVIVQDTDLSTEGSAQFEIKTSVQPSEKEWSDLEFAVKCVKHLKSNTIVLVKDAQLLGMGCGQTSRIDACQQAIAKAKHFGFNLEGAVMASDAFFPFPDCVELVNQEGIKAVVQPGGSIKDQLSIDYCNDHNMSMVFTGIRHFKH